MYAAALVREYAPAESGETVCVHETFLPVFIYVKGGTSYYEIADLRNADDDVLRAMKIYLPLANPDSSRWQKWHLSLAAECDAKAAEMNQ